MRGVVARHLPRVRRADLVDLLGVEPRAPEVVDLAHLAEAGAAAIGRTRLATHTPIEVMARAAAVQLARRSFTTRTVAEAPNLTPRSVERLARHEVHPNLLAAVQGQWRLRSLVASETWR